MSSEITIQELIETLKTMTQNNVFKNNLTRVVFPYFKNYRYFSEMNFKFPLNVFVGKNGCGKSSALHALYGAPKGNNINKYWFSTELDPIKEFEEENERHCYFYEYKNNNDTVEVLYQRMHHKRQKSPDYWETARPKKNTR